MIRKFFAAVISVILTAAALSGCGVLSSSKGLQRYSESYYDCFDTVISVTAYCSSQEEFGSLSEELHGELLRLHRMFDIYNEYEGLNNACTVNRLAGTKVEVPQELMDLVLLGKEMHGQTKGNVNIAMGAVLRLWHDAREKALALQESGSAASKDILPSEEALKEASLHCDINMVTVDDASRTITLEDPEMSIDLGAMAKGYAVQLAAEKLASKGRSGVLINAGGNVVCLGEKPSAEGASSNKNPADVPWPGAGEIPVEGSSEPYADLLSLSECSLVTSGVYQRFFELDGVRYHHIIDKDSLRPENRYLSVSVVYPQSGLADAYSTAVFNMPFEEGKAFAESIPDLQVLWIFPDGTKTCTSGWEALRQ